MSTHPGRPSRKRVRQESGIMEPFFKLPEMIVTNVIPKVGEC